MKTVSYDRGRVLDAPPEIVACLWSNWEIYDEILNNRFSIRRIDKDSWSGRYCFEARLSLKSRTASLDSGRFVYSLSASVLGLPSATVVTLRYDVLPSGKTAVHGEFQSTLSGFAKALEPLVRGRITRAVDAVMDGGQLSCETIAHDYATLTERLPPPYREQIDLYMDTAAQLRKGMFVENNILKGPQEVASGGAPVDSPRVFIVHGRNEEFRRSTADLLSRHGFDPIVLQDRPNVGQTLIEKFELHADADYAVVLLTADDKGGLSGSRNYKPRARQNVVFELGYFIGRITRRRVCALYRDGVELPSDFGGIGYIPLDDEGSWKAKLIEELRALGFEIKGTDGSVN